MKLVMLFTIVCSSMVRSNTLSQENNANFDEELDASQEELMGFDLPSNAPKRSGDLDFSYNTETKDVKKNGPNYWSKISDKCGGKFQSPINIVTNRGSVNGKLRNPTRRIKITFPGESSSTLENNGHTLQLTINKNNPKLFAFTSRISKEYNLKQIHFHFGCKLDERITGSEHRIDGKAFDLEVHFVFQDNNKVVSVVGVLFNEPIPSNATNNDIKSPLKRLSSRVLRFKGTNNYYSYKGSLTTPPCTEEVRWKVIADPKLIQKEFMKFLRKLPSHTNHEVNGLLCDNSRPIQNYQHTVYYKHENAI